MKKNIMLILCVFTMCSCTGERSINMKKFYLPGHAMYFVYVNVKQPKTDTLRCSVGPTFTEICIPGYNLKYFRCANNNDEWTSVGYQFFINGGRIAVRSFDSIGKFRLCGTINTREYWWKQEERSNKTLDSVYTKFHFSANGREYDFRVCKSNIDYYTTDTLCCMSTYNYPENITMVICNEREYEKLYDYEVEGWRYLLGKIVDYD